MDLLKKRRTKLRRQLTKGCNEMEELIGRVPVEPDELEVCLGMAEVVQLELEEVNREIGDLIDQNDDIDDDEVDAEEEGASKYRKTFLMLRKKVERIIQGASRVTESAFSTANDSVPGGVRQKGYHLPKMKMKEFNGELKEWLGFWSQFQRIHLDETLDNSVKFQYLDMAMVKGSRAKDLVDSYPKTEANYPKAVEALISRFGREDLQVEVYVRELLRLVIFNVNQSKEKISFSRLFDQLEAHLRALESLGVTSEKYDAMLYPLVESCLPVPILRAWERSSMSKEDGSKKTPPLTKLHFLMQFLRAEVESEQRISLASEGFGYKESSLEPSIRNKKFAGKMKKFEDGQTPTAAGFVNEVKRFDCSFCDGPHETGNCNKAHELSGYEKRDKLRRSGYCFVCLKKGCRSKDCNSDVSCILCGKRHHTIMCSNAGRKPADGKPRQEHKVKADEEVNVATSTANINESSREVYLQTAMVELVNGNKRKKVRALFDTGSQRTHILKSTAAELGYKQTGTVPLTHVLFGGTRTEVVHRSFRVGVVLKNSTQPIDLEVLDQELICNRLPSVRKGPWMSQLREKGIYLEDMEKGDEQIQMLIGGDVYGKLLTGRTEQLKCGLTAVETRLGWTVMGTFRESTPVSSRINHNMLVTSLTVSQMSVPDLWRLESIGIHDPIDAKSQQEEEAEVLRKFEETVTRTTDGRYVVKLPWRADVPDLPNNRVIAEKRLHSTTKKLNACVEKVEHMSLLGTIPESALPQGADWNRAEVKKNMFTAYDDVFNDWMKESIIEEIPDDGLLKSHYLPHRAVVKEESTTTKIRPVFDASCKSGRAPSLNDCLEKGPNLIDLIPSVMMRFRREKIGVISDIRKAFLMIDVAEEDRDFLRFLWWEDASCKRMKIYRHRRVVFGVNSSPFLLGAVINHHLAQYEDDRKEVAEKLKRSLYVDNSVTSVNNGEELHKFRKICTEIMAEARMDLRLWQDSFDVSEEMEERVVPVLGMKWDRFLDQLYCDAPSTTVKPEEVTKRNILSLTQQIFDPMGILAPVTVQPKLLLQEAWAQKKGWDEVVEEDARKRFLRWTKDLPVLTQIQIPRCFSSGNGDDKDWSLHCFTDASSYAYGAVIFLRCEGNPVSVQLLQAKARVAPLKKSTIPRLELMGCLIGARLTAAVCSSLDLENVPTYYWSDSSTALSWIRRNDDWGTFVGNRVREILSLTEAQQWRHVPGRINPADLPSRGCTASELLESRWWEGPDWLRESQSLWPGEIPESDEVEVMRERKGSIVSQAALIESPWFLDGCVRYTPMLRRACYVFRFVDLVMKRTVFTGEITVPELDAVEKRLVRAVQSESFGGSDQFRKSFKTLGVFKDEAGLLRLKTKLLMRKDSPDFRTPMLLPTSHPFVKKLIMEMHVENCHAGAQVLISIIREKFWIVHSRRAINKVIKTCQRCKRFNAKNVEVEAAVLPEDRVRDAAPFEIVGVDLAGPLFLRNQKKAWIVLYTCAIYRAVHLELVTSLDTEHFLQSLRRFIARRGRPNIIYSDNGTNFKGAANLFKALDWEKIQRRSALEPIEWKFSPPSAPWWGGFWERMVRSVKDLLVRVLGRSSVYYEELVTILCDVESVINQRPLTVMTEDGEDQVALTPAMFLQGIREAGVPEMDKIDMDGLNRRFRYRQELVDQLRSRFRKDYLGNLIQRAKDKANFTLREGDLVLIGDDNKKRVQWLKGRVIELVGKRIAKVKTQGGIITRPVRRLFPMELNPMDDVQKAEVEVFNRRGRRIKKPTRFEG